jgi:DNA repair exonuclease SbcCD ATPase subunit
VIRKLALTNWRNYEDVEIDLKDGTTFVVASNGVGKSSLVEAARFALFGLASADAASPIRSGTDAAMARIELVLPTGQVLAVERIVKAKRSRSSAPLVVIELDGTPVDASGFEDVVRQAYGAESSFLARLTMPAASREMDVPTALGLEEHLGQYFGVDGLQRAISVLDRDLKSVEKAIRQIKVGNSASAKQLADLQAAVDASRATVQSAAAEHQRAQVSHDALRNATQELQAHAAWSTRRDQWLAQVDEVLGAVIAELGDQQVSRDDLEDRLQRASDDAAADIEQARIHIAVQRSRADIIRANQASLDSSEEDCPVCRRPLDEVTIAHAHRSNEAELMALETEIAGAIENEISAIGRRDRIQALLRRWRAIPAFGPEPELSTTIQTVSDGDLAAASEAVSLALDRLVAARTREADAERSLQAAREADDAMRQLEQLFAAEAEIRVALSATTATHDELLEHTIGPLASEVSQRWADLFPGRGPLSTRADATMTRTVNGHQLPFNAFSTGESIGAQIVLRLLVAQMATDADFCWFDEPLEHLDPDVRRQVANILAGATSTDRNLRQVVVTTYEEPLARQLHARTPDTVSLLDVRTAVAT